MTNAMTQNEIRKILERDIKVGREDCVSWPSKCLHGLVDATQAITDLIERQPIGRAWLIIEILAEYEENAHMIDECIKAAQEMVEGGEIRRQPVDRVAAMALFVQERGGGRYYVPDAELELYTVDFTRGEWFCHTMKGHTLCSRGECDHVRAVELYLVAQNGSKDDDD